MSFIESDINLPSYQTGSRGFTPIYANSNIYILGCISYKLYLAIIKLLDNDKMTLVSDDEIPSIYGSQDYQYTHNIPAIEFNGNILTGVKKTSDKQGYAYLIVTDKDIKVKKVKNLSDKIIGVTKTSGTEGQTIDVYVPNVQ